MAGPAVLIRFIPDFTKLKAGLDTVAGAAKTSGSNLKSAFQPGLAALNQTGVLGPFHEALEGAGKSLDTIKAHAKDMPLAFAAAGAGVAAIGTSLQAVGSKDKAAHQQLQAAAEASGKSYEGFGEDVEKAIKHQERFGTNAAKTQDALRILTQATGDPKKAMDNLNVATDLAAAKHISLDAAATLLARGMNGNAKVFKQFGIQLVDSKKATAELASASGEAQRADDASAKARQKLADVQAQLSGKTKLTVGDQIRLRDAQAAVTLAADKQKAAHQHLSDAQQANKDAAHANADAVDKLAGKLKGQASASADTFSGHMKALKTVVEDQVASFGNKYGPALQGAGMAMAGIGTAAKLGGSAISAVGGAMKKAELGTKLLSAATKVQTAVQWALKAAMDAAAANPWVLVIGALIAIIVLLATKTQFFQKTWEVLKKVAGEVWHAILGAISAVWDWVQKNWPLLLGVLLGPFGLLLGLIIKHWDAIWKFLSGLPKDVAKWAADLWHWVSDEFGKLLGFLQKSWDAIWAWLTGLGKLIAKGVEGMWHGIVAAFEAEVAGVHRVWDLIWGWFVGLGKLVAKGAAGLWSGITAAFDREVSGLRAVWDRIWGWFTGLPSAIGRVTSGMWGGITGAFRAALNDLIDLWDKMHFTIGGWKIDGPLGTSVTLPKVDLGLPHIPHLSQGGLMTGDGLVYAHAGEVISPAPPRLQGPAAVIERAYFSSDVDIDLFSRQLAWHVKVQRI